MQIVDDEDAKSDQFSMSAVGKPMNTVVPIVSAASCFKANHKHF